MGEIKAPDIPRPKPDRDVLQRILYRPDGMQKACVWLDGGRRASEHELLAELWVCDAPLPGEELMLREGDAQSALRYEVTRRVFCADTEEMRGKWDLYVRLIGK